MLSDITSNKTGSLTGVGSTNLADDKPGIEPTMLDTIDAKLRLQERNFMRRVQQMQALNYRLRRMLGRVTGAPIDEPKIMAVLDRPGYNNHSETLENDIEAIHSIGADLDVELANGDTMIAHLEKII